MNECKQYDDCHKAFDVLFGKLDRLDEAIRGNGKLGILIRLDRLEQDARRQGKLIWMILGAFATAAATGVVAWIAR